MTTVVNKSSSTLNVRGVDVPPMGMADVPASADDLKRHMFAQRGVMEVAGGGAQQKPGRKPKAEAEKAEGSEG